MLLIYFGFVKETLKNLPLFPAFMAEDQKSSLELEQRASELFLDIAVSLIQRIASFQLLRDDLFVHRRDRTSNDIHLFLELRHGGYFHLRSYTRHMLSFPHLSKDALFLTGYRKRNIELEGGTHSLRQEWYPCDFTILSQEIVSQNEDLF